MIPIKRIDLSVCLILGRRTWVKRRDADVPTSKEKSLSVCLTHGIKDPFSPMGAIA